MRSFCSVDQRRAAIGSPARWTTASNPSSAPASISDAVGSHKTDVDEPDPREPPGLTNRHGLMAAGLQPLDQRPPDETRWSR